MWIIFAVFFVGMAGWGVDQQVHPCDYPHSSAYEECHVKPLQNDPIHVRPAVIDQ